MIFLLILALVLLFVGALLFWVGRRTHRETGLPMGEVLYSDMGTWQRVERPLKSQRYGLIGKPDYLVRVKEAGRSMMIPVEVKSRKRPRVAYDSHILQLAVYGLLVEETMHQRPAYGLLRYADATIKIPFDDQLRRQVIKTADAVRQARHSHDVLRQHHSPSRCRNCGYRDACGVEALSS